MEGYRTYIVAIIMGVIGIVNNATPDALPISESDVNALLAVLTPILMLIMRKVTTTPPAL